MLFQDGGDMKASVAVQAASVHQFISIPFSDNQVFT